MSKMTSETWPELITARSSAAWWAVMLAACRPQAEAEASRAGLVRTTNRQPGRAGLGCEDAELLGHTRQLA